MNKITMLGTGNGGTLDLYNTCFVIQNDKGNFLVDTGGGIEVIKRLKVIGIQLIDIRNIFISHTHTDHILGIFWILKKIGILAMHGKITDKINIYCNDVVYEAIREVSKYILPSKLMEAVYTVTNFVILNDGDKHTICEVEYEFFDIKAKGTKQFGFEAMINAKKFVFLGDETLNPILYDRVKNADYVTHEAFCLDEEENIFHAYEKNHSTAKSASKVMNGLGVKNLILYHTEESHGADRKALYTKEGQEHFDGKVIVPNELESIDII
jgi:ribonuclease Z